MATKKDFTIGQMVWYSKIDNRRNEKLFEAEVIKVGRKYVTVKRKGYSIEIEFEISSLRVKAEYIKKDRLYFSEDEFQEDLERKSNILKLRNYNFTDDLTLEQTRKLLEILSE